MSAALLYVTLLLWFAATASAPAGLWEDIGYTALKAELGSAMPDGSRIPPVTQCEAATLTSRDDDGTGGRISTWMPNPGNREFNGKQIINKSGSLPYYSGHATGVGVLFYGKTSSIAPGIVTVESYLASHWLGRGFLRGNDTLKPFYSDARLANHSWIGSADGNDANLLRRIDWVIGADEYVQIVGPCRNRKPLLGSAFNTIAVGNAAGESGAGSVGVDTVYTSGRSCPQLVAPLKNASSTVPVVAAGAVILLALGHGRPDLSRDPSVRHSVNRNGATVFNAERSEVVKAALMAGADRDTHNSVTIDGITPDIEGYRTNPEYRTADGLDRRYGAGQFNIYNSYHIIAAGEQNSREDDPAAGGEITEWGFDYDPFYGGKDGSNTSAIYAFNTGDEVVRLGAALVWNIVVDGGSGTDFAGATELYDLDLLLVDVTKPSAPQVLDSSSGSGGNTENLWVQLRPQRKYHLQVKPGKGQGTFNWDYALAWRLERKK